MQSLQRTFLLLSFLLIFYIGRSQKQGRDLIQKEWDASWITVTGESKTAYGVYLFRKPIFINQAVPGKFIVHLSADNRYKLFVNEKQVSLGPARGDLEHWNYTTLDIGSFLHTGSNIIAAMVWNDGEWKPEGQISLRTGFILQGDDSVSRIINTNATWKCIHDSSYQPLPFKTPTYYVAGPGELVDLKLQPAGWETLEFQDADWGNAQVISPGIPKNIIGGYGTVPVWLMVPSMLPPMELKNQRLQQVRESAGIAIPTGFPHEKISITVPANSVATVLLDQGFLANAYPAIIFSGGSDGTISMGYAESLYTGYPSKGNRNETSGKTFIGRKDSILSNGKKDQSFTTLFFRTYRYIQLRVTTKNDPLVIEDIYGTATGYPFEMNAVLESDMPELNKMLDIGWRTARNCAMETYMDCPYYEQLQYIGDTRIQALVSLYNSGDTRLLRNAMNELDNSRQAEGLIFGRYPSYTRQFIPSFCFWYIGMLHDYMMYGNDSNYIKNKLGGERQLMMYFRNHQNEDGSLRNVPYWMFTDWVDRKGWVSGTGPVGKDGSSSLFDFQLLWAYQLAADLESKYGMKVYASMYGQFADDLKKTIRKRYWDEEKRLFADRPEKDLYSQHANTLAILTGMFDRNGETDVAKRLLTDSSLAPASIYFKYYLHRALIRAGLGNDYLNWLGKWRENMNMGMTTWAEISDINNARSDCHAWGSSPNIEFFRTILGIDSDAPGFSKVRIEPHLGALLHINGEIPHPQGKIKASYALENNHWNIRIDLPSGVSGNLIWKNQTYLLKAGPNKFLF
jgi:alpha-L-rhamnosidase